MRNKIILSLVALFALFSIGAGIATLNLKNTTIIFNNLIKLHQIEGLRHVLIERILKVQSELYTINSPREVELSGLVENVSQLEASALNCLSCHHQPAVQKDLEEIQTLIDDFKSAISYYVTASANRERLEQMEQEAALIGNRLLFNTERMAFEASAKVGKMTSTGLAKMANAKVLLFTSLALACLFGMLVARNLTRAITRPINAMVIATRKIAAGDLGYTLTETFPAEFGELASHLNSMSRSLRVGYAKLEEEIAERKQTEEALRQSEERYALAARAANDGLWDWNLQTGQIYFSPRWKAMLGFAEEESLAQRSAWFDLVHAYDRPQLEAKLNAYLAGNTPHFDSEYRMQHRDGSWRWMLSRGMALLDPNGKAERLAGSQSDITARKIAEEQLTHDAFHDALTHLPNRALFKNRLQQAIQTVQARQDHLFAVLFLDLDRFKTINDSLGHLAGDQLLVAVGKRLLGFVRPSDTVARLGGDEFAILLPEINSSLDAIHIAERIQNDLPQPFTIGGQEVFSTASVGVALSSSGHQGPEQFLREADLAMYHAKANGKARYEIYDAEMHEKTVDQLRLETDLRKALERKEFELYYQPILALDENRVTGFEALLRWQHPLRGLLCPGEFLAIAEETGLITAMGQWALQEGCRQLSLWQHQLPEAELLTLNLNFSSKEFTPLLLQQVKNVQQEFDLVPYSLRLEITESTIMGNPDTTAALLTQLKAAGVGLQIDDFGTGYSSLSYLHQFPIDALKIDHSFVSNMLTDRDHLEIIKTIVSLAHSLGMVVIAEGVETLEEYQLLQALGCEYAQGYYISPPLAAPAARDFLLSHGHHRTRNMNLGG